jgi:hypothetical protein
VTCPAQRRRPAFVRSAHRPFPPPSGLGPFSCGENIEFEYMLRLIAEYYAVFALDTEQQQCFAV